MAMMTKDEEDKVATTVAGTRTGEYIESKFKHIRMALDYASAMIALFILIFPPSASEFWKFLAFFLLVSTFASLTNAIESLRLDLRELKHRVQPLQDKEVPQDKKDVLQDKKELPTEGEVEDLLSLFTTKTKDP